MAATHLQLNCDLGEISAELDRKLMPFIDQANIACGGHAGDQHSMLNCIELADQYGVAIGAHPSYPDRSNFGRQSMSIDLDKLEQSLFEQVASLQALCQRRGVTLRHIKAHGALYNDSNKDPALLALLVQLARDFNCALMLQSLPINDKAERLGAEHGVELIYETFADRAYSKSGLLVPRTQNGAVHEQLSIIVEQALGFAQHGCVRSIDDHILKLRADSLCVHGDSNTALLAVRAIYDALH
ncbi:5-oxoprolinase subunit PxpA [Agaribacterium haliotis]|uniref:5-oxoprolinase subunit PxpA n=1 Tax=Agaribacterium haliotis TaxID=2013869 RepID=UPI000BB542F7|nr:5-oxoprolinase subunit PxpA [Agaribacterium haliotis]